MTDRRAWRARWTRPHPAAGAALPSMSHATATSFQNVYEPSDDTYLFVDVIRGLRPFLLDEFFGVDAPLVCVELGPGSGMISTAWCDEFKAAGSFMIAVDINSDACALSAATLAANHFGGVSDVVQSDLLVNFDRDAIDVLLFNPPYVTTPSEEVGGRGLSAAWAGGRLGREVLDRIFPQLPRVMRRKAVLLLLLSEENRPDEVASVLETKHGFTCYAISPRRCMNERLLILMALRQ